MPRYEFEIGGRIYEVDSERMPSGAQMRSIASRLGGGGASSGRGPERPYNGRPYSPDEFTERPKGPEGSAGGRFASGAWDMLNPVALVEGVASAVRHPIGTARGLVSAQTQQLGKARDALAEGRYSEAAGYGAAGVLPVVGPVAAQIGERMGAGDVAGGLGAAAGVLAPTGAAVSAGRKALGAGAARKIPPKAPTATQIANAQKAESVRWALDNGIPVDAATASGNRVVRAAKAVADHTLGGAIVGQRAADARTVALAETGRRLAARVDDVAADSELAGSSVRQSVEGVIRDRAAEADSAYAKVRAAERNAMPDDVPVSRPVAGGRTVDQGFIGHWLADDLNEMGYQAGGRTKKGYDIAAQEWMPGDSDAARYGIGVGSGRVAGTPTQEMFHAAGVSGSRAEIADKVRRYLTGEYNNPRVGALIDAMGEAWDGQRFDFQLLTDETLARTGLKRNQFKSPITMPALEAPGASKFFGDAAENVAASGTEPMQFAVPLAPAKEALRPIFDRLQRKRELVGNLYGDEAKAATALDALISGPDHAPLSVVDAALGDIKAAARGAAMPELRTQGQGLAAEAVKQLETLVESKARETGVWDDLRAGRDATIQKWTAADTLKKLNDEPVKTFRMLTSAGDAAIERLREVQKLAPGEMKRIGRGVLDEMLTTATAEGGFGREAKLWADWQRLGPETKAILFPDRELRTSLDRFFQVGKMMAENPNPSGSALVGLVGGQGGALGTMVFFDPIAAGTGAAITAIGGATLSKLLNSPRTARLLVDGMKTPRTASAARSLAARLKVAVRPAIRTGQASQTARPEPSR